VPEEATDVADTAASVAVPVAVKVDEVESVVAETAASVAAPDAVKVDEVESVVAETAARVDAPTTLSVPVELNAEPTITVLEVTEPALTAPVVDMAPAVSEVQVIAA
jgi:hypothetical protein